MGLVSEHHSYEKSMICMISKARWSLLHFIGFSTLGILTVAALQDFDTASYLAECSLIMQKEVDDEYSDATTTFMAYALCLCWTKPLQTLYFPLRETYTLGMRSGNSEYAMWALVMQHVALPFMMGKPLATILDKCASCASQAEEVRQQDQHIYVRLFWQLMLNLSGQSGETKSLTGKAYDRERYEVSNTIHITGQVAELALFVFFGEWQEAAELTIRKGEDYANGAPGFFLNMIETFLRCLALYAMANKTGKRKYKKHSNRLRKKIKGWIDKGNPNVHHYYNILSAEHAILKKDYKKVEKLYREAVAIAARTGNMYVAALANERFANFSMVYLSDEDDAKYRTKEAIRFYKAWGADAKVQLLEEVLEDLVSARDF